MTISSYLLVFVTRNVSRGTWVLQLTTCEILLVANLNPIGQQMMG